MVLTPGTRLGVYEVTAQIGVGGMGEVYRATDTRLKRQVAIKVLPASVAADAERLARFQREAEVLASLNHPNIAAIYGLEDADGVKALVMELVEGPTLADRIALGAIPVDEALPIARQIAEALDAAHEQGIIHRDLKPANIKVRADGTVKVLDFGLAKAMEPAGAMALGHSTAPTVTTPAMTQAGMILGTAAYMSARIVFRSLQTGAGDLYQKLASGAGVEERLVTSDQLKTPASWSADGRFLLYSSTDRQTSSDLWVVPMVGDHTPLPFLKTPFREVYGAFSPDGRWVAYQSDESGRTEIYVRPFVSGAGGPATGGAGEQWQVSTAGGIHPAWSPSGKELYYLNHAGAMLATPITVTGSAIEPGAPVVLFSTRIYGGGVDTQQGRQYDVAPDGRFLINTELDGADAPITLLMNWNPEATK